MTSESSVSEEGQCSPLLQKSEYYRCGEQQAAHDLERVLPVARRSRHGSEICLKEYWQRPMNSLQLNGPTLRQYAQYLCGYRMAFSRLVSKACKTSVTLPHLEPVPADLIIRAA